MCVGVPRGLEGEPRAREKERERKRERDRAIQATREASEGATHPQITICGKTHTHKEEFGSTASQLS